MDGIGFRRSLTREHGRRWRHARSRLLGIAKVKAGFNAAHAVLQPVHPVGEVDEIGVNQGDAIINGGQPRFHAGGVLTDNRHLRICTDLSISSISYPKGQPLFMSRRSFSSCREHASVCALRVTFARRTSIA